MNFRRFPFDSQMCPIMFESFKYTVDTLYFNWLDSPVDIDPVWWVVIMDSEHFGKKTSYGQFPITVPVCKWFGYIYMCNLTTWDLILVNFLYIKILLISRAPDSYPDLKIMDPLLFENLTSYNLVYTCMLSQVFKMNTQMWITEGFWLEKRRSGDWRHLAASTATNHNEHVYVRALSL